jgi:hypothetical protein
MCDAHKVYKYASAATPKYNSGDHVLVTITANQMQSGREVLIAGEMWRVVESHAVFDGVHHLVRRV